MSETPEAETCEYEHPHPSHPCGKVFRCEVEPSLCAGLSPCVCGYWRPATEAMLDDLYLEAWGVA